MSFFSRRSGQAVGNPREQAAQPPAPPEASEQTPLAPEAFPVDPLIWQSRIAVAAYYRWLERGSHDGTDQQDWYDAEADLSKHKGSSADS